MPLNTKLFTVMPWNKGVNTTLEESLIDPGQLTIANNVSLGVSGARKKRDGMDMNWDDGLMEVTNITCTAEDANTTLEDKSFILQDDGGSVGVWYDIDPDSGTTPPPTGAGLETRAIEITGIAVAATATTVANTTATILNADSKFVAYNNGAVLTVIQNVAGTRTDASDASGGEATSFKFHR